MTHLPADDPHRLLILGASTRAAAAIAVRAGFDPVCADRFGDEDLRRIAEVIAINVGLAGVYCFWFLSGCAWQ